MTWRILVLFVGLGLYGAAIGLMIRSELGASPWDVLAQGVSRRSGLTFGLSTVVISAVVLLCWFPLRVRPGWGTLANAVSVGLFADATLALVPPTGHWLQRSGLLAGGVVLLAFATAVYLSPRFGPGPRDGLFTGLVRRTGLPVWAVRGCLEVTVLVIGWLLGGIVGIGTVVFAAAVGPLVHVFLRWLRVDVGH
ncbi:membrane protein [Tersicoccus solisilvae]|uniref:Membrane protein n=2 Tax=Tersicoccus solisilvae TaxID=1882339 RepID=A0ABQ1NUY6_9MICC|nr:membrane protein [Tersicoccus solisilvae]